MIAALGYAADAWIIVTYLVLARTGRARPFHWANALGCFPIIAFEIIVSAWVPMVLTIMFGIVGWIGVLKNENRIHHD